RVCLICPRARADRTNRRSQSFDRKQLQRGSRTCRPFASNQRCFKEDRGCIVWLGLIICRKPACLSTIFDVCNHFVSILKLRWLPSRRSRVPADVGVRPLPILSPCCLTGLWLATGPLCLDASIFAALPAPLCAQFL